MLYKKHNKELPCPLKFVEYVSTLDVEPNPFKIARKNDKILERIDIHKSITFDECMEMAVLDLEACEKTPAIYWSGGLDSSGIVAAIEKHGSKNLKNNFEIATTPMSALENPKLFDLISFKYKIHAANKSMEEIAKVCTLIHGNGADQLYGTLKINSFVLKYGIDALKNHHSDLFIKEPKYKAYECIVSYCPAEIKTIYDFFQWFAMSQEHELALNRLESINWKNQQFPNYIEYFYNTDKFFTWAINHRHEILPDNNWNRYKEHLRLYVEQHFNVDLTTKTQYASGWHTIYLKDIICCSFNDGTIVKFFSELEEKYENILLS